MSEMGSVKEEALGHKSSRALNNAPGSLGQPRLPVVADQEMQEAVQAINAALNGKVGSLPGITATRLAELYTFLDVKGRAELVGFLRGTDTTKPDFIKVVDDLHAISAASNFSGQMKAFETKAMRQQLITSCFLNVASLDQGYLPICPAASALSGLLGSNFRSQFTGFVRRALDDGFDESLGVELPKNTMAAYEKSGFSNLASYLFQTGFMQAGTGSYNPATGTSHRPWAAAFGESAVAAHGGLWSLELRRALGVFCGKVEQFDDFTSNENRGKTVAAINQALQEGRPVVVATRKLELEGIPVEPHAVSIIGTETLDGKRYFIFKDTRAGNQNIDRGKCPQIELVNDRANTYRVPAEYFLREQVDYIQIPQTTVRSEGTLPESVAVTVDGLIEVKQFRERHPGRRFDEGDLRPLQIIPSASLNGDYGPETLTKRTKPISLEINNEEQGYNYLVSLKQSQNRRRV